jgi:hypothetical protein
MKVVRQDSTPKRTIAEHGFALMLAKSQQLGARSADPLLIAEGQSRAENAQSASADSRNTWFATDASA